MACLTTAETGSVLSPISDVGSACADCDKGRDVVFKNHFELSVAILKCGETYVVAISAFFYLSIAG